MHSFLRRHWLLSILLLFFIFLVGKRLLRDVTGKPAFDDPEVVAQWIVDGKHDPKLCLELRSGALPFPLPPIQVPFVMGPTLEMQRDRCVYEVAKLSNNPSACELLMPSEYGLSCIGEIWGPLIDESNCHWYRENEVRCFEGKELVPRIYSCDPQNMNVLPDECIHRLAFKEKNEEVCNGIDNEILRSVCRTRIAVWNQYPQLRSTIYFNDNIE